MPTNDPLPLPQLLVALLLGGLAIRFFFFSSSSSASNDGDASTGPPSRTRPNRVREADVLTVLQMFPQLQRRSVMWDLMRNGGNVAATTERILTGRGLENVSFLRATARAKHCLSLPAPFHHAALLTVHLS